MFVAGRGIRGGRCRARRGPTLGPPSLLFSCFFFYLLFYLYSSKSFHRNSLTKAPSVVNECPEALSDGNGMVERMISTSSGVGSGLTTPAAKHSRSHSHASACNFFLPIPSFHCSECREARCIGVHAPAQLERWRHSSPTLRVSVSVPAPSLAHNDQPAVYILLHIDTGPSMPFLFLHKHQIHENRNRTYA